MCGILGFFRVENASNLVVNGIKFMNYRGVDGYGLYDGKKCHISDSIIFDDAEENEIAIGHCLHAVVNKINQPFSGQGIFAVNCEIYNWNDLCLEYNIKARNDAELFFCLVEKFGLEKSLDLIDGDYAGVYFRDSLVYLFRDKIGVKPLWYSLENGLAFASERKVLRNAGYLNTIELNPRQILIYNVNTGKIKIKNLSFYKIEKINEDYNNIKMKLEGIFVNSISKRIPDSKFGLLFSGGVDSSFIALTLKNLGVDFKCYVCCVKGIGVSKDEEYARKVAEDLNLDLEVVEISIDNLAEDIGFVCNLIESNNVTKVAVAMPFYFACKKAKEDNIKVMFSGVGSEDIFAGYERYTNSQDINKECYNNLLNIYEKDLYRDDIITMFNNMELRVPFLDKDMITFSLAIDSKYKIKEGTNKFILRDIAFARGLAKEFAFRKRSAAQYGSNFLKAIDKLSKLNNFKTKSEYLAGFYNEGNVRLGVLFSSGKDSCYAMHILKKQNYDIKCLITLESKNKESYMYHTPNVEMVKYQAEAMNIPLIVQNTFGEKEKELEDLKKALVKAKKKYHIEGIAAGAIFSTYQRDRIQAIATELGLKVFLPLWHKRQDLLLKELIDNNFEIIVVQIAADGLDEKFLGRKIDEYFIEDMINLNKKNGINIAFEGGEAETLVLDCPMFKKKIVVEDYDLIMDGICTGLYKIKKVSLKDKN